ncbi:hypothetical protein ACSBR1_022423 [Camellia fascicularis]
MSKYVGLVYCEQLLNSSANPFVAVEFNMYPNPWDPPSESEGESRSSRKKKKKNGVEKKDDCDFSVLYEFEGETGPKKFSNKELTIATKNFMEEEKPVQGGFDGFYRGWCHEGKELLLVHAQWQLRLSSLQRQHLFDMVDKLGNFRLARLVDHKKGSQTTDLAKTMGYMAPECLMTSKANKESNVYSFGIVALEIAYGRKPIDPMVKEGHVRLVDQVWELCGRGNVLEAVDAKLEAYHPNHNCRPSVRQAIQVFNLKAPLPSLPPNMPMPTYLKHETN